MYFCYDFVLIKSHVVLFFFYLVIYIMLLIAYTSFQYFVHCSYAVFLIFTTIVCILSCSIIEDCLNNRCMCVSEICISCLKCICIYFQVYFCVLVMCVQCWNFVFFLHIKQFSRSCNESAVLHKVSMLNSQRKSML